MRTGMRHLGAAALSGLLILLAVSLAGCPRQRPELRVPITQLNLVEPGASASLEIRNAGRGKLEWSVTADAPWILLDRTEGEGEATVQVTIDAALLEPLSVNRGAITVRSNGGEKQVPVEAPTPVAALSPDYWPLEVGNEWTFNLAANAFPWIIYKDNIAPPRPFEIVTLRVADFRLVKELEVWRIDVDFIEEPTRPEKIVELEPVIRAFLRAAAWPTYWVKVGPEWFVALDEARVAGLPNTDGFMRVADLAKLPGYAAYVFYTDRLWTLTDEIEAVTAAVREELEPLDPELEAYFDRVYRGDRTQVEALLAAAAEAYRGYSGSPHPLVNDVLSLVGDAAAGVLPAADTAAELQGILSDTQVALNEYLEAAPEPTREDAVALLQAFGAEFQGYQNPDALLRGLVRFLAFGARKGAELLDTYEDMPPEDRVAVEAYLDHLMAAARENLDELPRDPHAYIDGLIEVARAYPDTRAAVRDVVDTTVLLLEALEVVVDVVEDYEFDEADLGNLGLLASDVAGFFAGFTTAYPENPLGGAGYIVSGGADQAMACLLAFQPYMAAVRSDLERIVEDLRAADSGHDIVEQLAIVGDTLAEFQDRYAEETGDPLARGLAISLRSARAYAEVFDGLLAELEALEFSETTGNLASLLPEKPIRITLDDFGIEDPPDCIAARVLLPGTVLEEETLYTTAAWARGLGLVYFGPFTLSRASVVGGR